MRFITKFNKSGDTRVRSIFLVTPKTVQTDSLRETRVFEHAWIEEKFDGKFWVFTRR